jgi:hypothetical protein
MPRLAMPRHRLVLAALAALGATSAAHAGITIGQGPFLGQDHASPPNQYWEEFQDWTHGDTRALHPVGLSSPRHIFNDGHDDARDLMAFYSRFEGSALYMRVDFFNLQLGSENGFLDLYVAIDCAPGGQEWLPDFTDARVENRWELCLALYSANPTPGIGFNLYRSDFSTDNGAVLGRYWNSELDSVEFGIQRQALTDAGWDGTSPVRFVVFTTKDNTDIGDSSVPDITDCIPDESRGVGDGIISGGVLSNATTGRAKFASIAHANQSVNQADDTRTHVFDPTNAFKTGFIRTLDTHEIFRVPLNIHLSGSLMVALKWALADPNGDPATTETPLSDGPAFLRRVGEFVDSNQAETPGSLIGGVLAEHIMPYFEGTANRESMRLFEQLTLNEYGLSIGDMAVMHIPERVIRQQPTGFSPLNGRTFDDIVAAGYKAAYVDEVCHFHHWWDRSNTTWSGAPAGPGEKPSEHKIHLANGVHLFMINDREDRAKFGDGTEDGGAALGMRFTLLEKARHADQAQLTLVFDDWEALAGKSFDPIGGSLTANNNQLKYQWTIRWLANRPWIEVVNLKEILERATNPAHPQYDPAWVIDHGTPDNLGIQAYEWLKHATQNSYDSWYYANAGGVPQKEQDFYNLVPVISGEQGDYFRRFTAGQIPSRPTNDAQAAAVDGPKIPSNMKFGDLNTPGTIMHDTWNAIIAAPDNSIRELALWQFLNMIYETAWHEEDNGDYQNTTFQEPYPNPDTTWDGMNTWALRLHNHIRDGVALARAAQWAEDVRTGAQGAGTIVEAVDADLDGENEYILRNNRVWVMFERRGGRIDYGFVWDPAAQDALSVIGVPVANPSAPGEEEYVGPNANRASAFKDMNEFAGQRLCDALWTATPVADGVRFDITLGGSSVSKTITLADGEGRLRATYTGTNTGGAIFTRFGAAPNIFDLIFNGRENLLSVEETPGLPGDPGQRRGVENSNGGFVIAETVSNTFINTAQPLLDAGYQNRNLALTEQFELFGGASGNATWTFDLLLGVDATVAADPRDSWMVY